jgi:hypothetical protein
MRLGAAIIGSILIGLILMCCGCSTTTSASAKAAPASWVHEHGGIHQGPEVQRAELAASRFAGVINNPVRVAVLASDQPAAWSWPEGQIFLTAGLVRALDDDQIVAVIGHELGHLLCAGHASTTVALVGIEPNRDLEIAADLTCLRLLDRTGTPRSSLRTALCNVLSRNDLSDALRAQLVSRIDRLP